MKNQILLTLYIILLCVSPAKCANFFSIEDRAEPIIQNNRITKNLMIKSSGSNVCTLSVSPLDAYIVNLQNPEIKIPVSHISISKNLAPHQLNYGKSTAITNNEPLNSQENIRVFINDTGYLEAGTYMTKLEFSNRTMDENISSVYVLTIDIPKEQEIYSEMNDVQIKIKDNKVFASNLTAVNETAPKINVKSNVPWSAYIDTMGMSKTQGEEYFRVKTVSPEVKSFEEKKMLLEPNKRYWIASGDMTTFNPAAFHVEYQHQNKTNGYSKPGVSNIAFKYIIEEKRL